MNFSEVLAEPSSPWSHVTFVGHDKTKLHEFECLSDDVRSRLYLSHVIHREDELTREAFKTLITESIKMAKMSLKGIYSMCMPFCRIHSATASFHVGNFAQFIVNQAEAMDFGEKKIFFYSHNYFQLHKRVPSEYGKLEFSFPMESFSGEREKFDLFVKKKLKSVGGEGAFWFEDLSVNPLLEKESTSSMKRMSGTLKEFPKAHVYYRHDENQLVLDLRTCPSLRG